MTTSRRFGFLAMCLLCAAFCLAQTVSIPVVAYFGVPSDHSTPQTFADFKKAGFDIGISYYPTIADAKKALDIAERQDVKIIARCLDADSNPTRMAKELSGHSALYGYWISDEPDNGKLTAIKKTIQDMRRIDSKKMMYLNIFPFYGNSMLKQLKTTSYDNYVRNAASSGIRVLSFDYYPITTTGIRSTWYKNLETIRQESQKAKIPFWGFVLSTPHFNYPQPTLADLRLQVYSNLVYGAQGIQYYTYWTPKAHDKVDYHNGPIAYDGKKTKTYNIVKSMNTELKSIGKLFANAQILSVRHLIKIPEGTSKLETSPVNIRQLIVSGKEGAIISQFVKNGKQYLAIVNKDNKDNMAVKIKWQNDTPVQITKSLQTLRVKNSYNIGAGDIIIFKLK